MLCLSGFELYSRWVPLNLANKFVNLHCLLMLMGSFIINLNMNLIIYYWHSDNICFVYISSPLNLRFLWQLLSTLIPCVLLFFHIGLFLIRTPRSAIYGETLEFWLCYFSLPSIYQIVIKRKMFEKRKRIWV